MNIIQYWISVHTTLYFYTAIDFVYQCNLDCSKLNICQLDIFSVNIDSFLVSTLKTPNIYTEILFVHLCPSFFISLLESALYTRESESFKTYTKEGERTRNIIPNAKYHQYHTSTKYFLYLLNIFCIYQIFFVSTKWIYTWMFAKPRRQTGACWLPMRTHLRKHHWRIGFCCLQLLSAYLASLPNSRKEIISQNICRYQPLEEKQRMQ